MKLGYELFVAWRYLRAPSLTRRGKGATITFVAGMVLALLGVGALIWASTMAPLDPGEIYDGATDWKGGVRIAGIVTLAVGVLVAVFGFLHHLQSIFTTISTYGVFLGVTALVIVLSVMNGFEEDLRKKILGSSAHILVTKEHGAFTEWRDVMAKVKGFCAEDTCVEASSPYITSEVVVAANSNHSGVIIKGVDPETVGLVTDLERNLEDPGALGRLWPLSPEGEPLKPDADAAPQPAPQPTPDAGVPDGDDDEEPIDFSVQRKLPDAGVRDPLVDRPLDPFDPDNLRRRPLSPDPRVQSLDGIIVGRELMRNLHLYVGQEVLVVSPLGKDTPAGQVPRTRPFRVAGVFYSGMYEYDSKFVYVSMPALQKFLTAGDEVTGVEIKVSDMDDTGRVVAGLQHKLGSDYRVADWKELNRSLFAALKLEKMVMFGILANIIVIACLSIILNLIMVVVEKAREIAILKSMGASNMGIMLVFVSEGLYIGLIGTIFGLLVGVNACASVQHFGWGLDANVYYINVLPVAMDPFAIAMVAVAGVGISVLATLYPSYVATKLKPVDGLRYQ
jgi:lipoprotein-releasing system permease protein